MGCVGCTTMRKEQQLCSMLSRIPSSTDRTYESVMRLSFGETRSPKPSDAAVHCFAFSVDLSGAGGGQWSAQRLAGNRSMKFHDAGGAKRHS